MKRWFNILTWMCCAGLTGVLLVVLLAADAPFWVYPLCVVAVVGSIVLLLWCKDWMKKYRGFEKVEEYNRILHELDKKSRHMEEAKERFLIGFLNLKSWETDIAAAVKMKREQSKPSTYQHS